MKNLKLNHNNCGENLPVLHQVEDKGESMDLISDGCKTYCMNNRKICLRETHTEWPAAVR